MNKELEIGTPVYWIIGSYKREGIVKQDNMDGTVNVICTKFDTAAMAIETVVQKEILQQAQEV